MKFVVALIILIALVALYLQRRGAVGSQDNSVRDADAADRYASRQRPTWGQGA